MIQSLLYQVLISQIPPLPCFLSRTILVCMEVDMTWPDGAREKWWGPGAMNRYWYCFLSWPQFPLPATEVSSGQAEVSSLWLSHISKDFTEDPASPCLWQPRGPAWNLLATDLIPNSGFSCCFQPLGPQIFLSSQHINYLQHPSMMHVGTSTCWSCPQD